MLKTAITRASRISSHLSRQKLATMTDPARYKLNHSMIRIKDPKVSIPFYEKNFGMKVIDKKEMKEAKFDLCKDFLFCLWTNRLMLTQISWHSMDQGLLVQAKQGPIVREFWS